MIWISEDWAATTAKRSFALPVVLTRRFEAESAAGELKLLDPPCGLASPIRPRSSSRGAQSRLSVLLQPCSLSASFCLRLACQDNFLIVRHKCRLRSAPLSPRSRHG